MRKLPFFLICLAVSPFGLSAQSEGDDPVKTLVGRLELEKYKATIKGLTQFGDRRQGTDRNRAAVDRLDRGAAEELWLSNRSHQVRVRSTAEYRSRPRTRQHRLGTGRRAAARRQGANRRQYRSDEAAGTKVGTSHPEEMCIISGHMDGHGWGEAANDDGSGAALVMELARILSSPDVQTERTIRFALWNNEETGSQAARAYIAQRRERQGKEDPPGSGRYPEPKWLGMIQHDIMLFDHGMPKPDGTMSKEQRPEADVNVEFQVTSKMAAEAQKLAWILEAANEKYATDYPATVGSHMTNTDSGPFMDIVPAISVRENERGVHIGNGWDPQWHQPTDVYATYNDKDFLLGLNAAQTTLGAIGQLTGATLKK